MAIRCQWIVGRDDFGAYFVKIKLSLGYEKGNLRAGKDA